MARSRLALQWDPVKGVVSEAGPQAGQACLCIKLTYPSNGPAAPPLPHPGARKSHFSYLCICCYIFKTWGRSHQMRGKHLSSKI